MILLLLMLGTLAMAQRGPRQENGYRHEQRSEQRGPERIIEHLQLSEEQQTQLEDIRLSHHKEMKDVRNNLEIKRAELNAEITKDVPDRKAIDKLVAEISDLNGSQFTLQINHRLEVRAMLDDKQKIKFDQMHEHFKGKGHRHRGGRHGF